MLNRLFRFLTRSPAEPAGQAPLNHPEDDEEGEAPPRNEAALADFVRLVTRHLGEETSETLVREVLESDEEPLFALKFAGDGDDDQRVILGVDWKADDEIEWQVDMLLDTRGIEARWQWELPEDQRKQTVMNALKSLDRWLQAHGLTLLHIDSGGDDYHVLFVKLEEIGAAVTLGTDADIDVSSHREFLIQQQDEDAQPY